MRKVFVVSWFFPPVNAAEGIVTFKLLKQSKYSFDVFTQKKDDIYAFAPDEKLKSKNINTIFSKEENEKKWILSAAKYYEEHKDEYSCIMTRCMPRESHEAALKIKKKNKKVYWVASFSDPLAYNPYTKIMEEKNPFINSKKTIKNLIKCGVWMIRRLHYRLTSDPEIKNRKIQRLTLKKADKIIFNNEYQKEYMLSKYKNLNLEDKCEIIPHSYDEDFYVETKNKHKGKKIITFLGHLDDYRNARALLEAVNLMKQKNSKFNEEIEIRFYGNLGNKDKLYIINNELFDIIRIFKPVTYLESLRIMKESDYLLSIDADLREYLDKNIFFASKIADYLGSKTKVFAITMNEGASKDILLKAGSIVSDFDKNSICEKLDLIINNDDIKQNFDYINEFNDKKVSKKLDEILRCSEE